MNRHALGLIAIATLTATAVAGDWSRFRGPHGSGHIPGPEIPTEWSADTNLKWRTALPGSGASSPVVHGDRIYVTCYTGYGVQMDDPGNPEDLVRHLLAFDRSTGKELWRASVPTKTEPDPYQGFITQHGYASSTPVTDGEHVYVVFGKDGLFAFDSKDGKQQWQVDLGEKSDPARWGDGSSPILIDNTLVIDAGILGHKFTGIDKRTGKQLWALEDAGFTNSWQTPVDLKVGDRTQVIAHVPNKVMGLNPATGEVIWSAGSPLSDASAGSIVTRDGVAFLMGSRAGHGLAVRCDGRGDVSDSHVVWNTRLRSGICTPVIVGDKLYWSGSGQFMAADTKTGEYVYRVRLPRLGGPTGGFPNADYSSPIAIGDKIVQFTRSGESYVIEATDEFKLAGHNPSFEGDESAFSATPAASNGQLFMRSERFLYCIGK